MDFGLAVSPFASSLKVVESKSIPPSLAETTKEIKEGLHK